MIRARMRRPRRSVSCCSAVYAVAPWSLDGFRPLALLIPLPDVAPDANRAVVGAVVFRRPPSSVNGEMAVRNLPCGGACMSPAHAASPAARWSRTAIPALPSPGDQSMVSAPTCSPLCGLPRLIGSRPSQESVNK